MNIHLLVRMNDSEGFWASFKRHGGIEWSIAIGLLIAIPSAFYWLIVLLVEVTT